LIEEYVARGVFRAAPQPQRGSTEVYRITWFRDQVMMLEIDAKRNRACLIDVLPPITGRSLLDRQLRTWLRMRQAPGLPVHRRLDPTQLELKVSNRAGHMQIALTSLCGDLTTATRKLLLLVNELYLDFLAAPERFDWIQEAFDLDPDNLRWP
jgi:hypothetical protein